MGKTAIQLVLTAQTASATRIEVEPVAGFAGDPILVTSFNIPAGVKNWIAEVPRGRLWVNPMRWQYLPDGQAQASLLFGAVPAGEWEYVLYLNDSARPEDIVARSPVVVILAIPQVNRDPIWPNEALELMDGAAITRSLKLAFDPDGDALTFAVVAPLDRDLLRQSLFALGKDPNLSDGFAFNEATMELSYDGRAFGTDATTPSIGPLETGIRISADDGR